MATNDFVYGHRGIIYKQQYNARIYQPIGNNGDFISIAGHYNQNRNNFGGSLPLRNDLVILNAAGVVTGPRNVGSAATNRFPLNADERDYTVARCQINQVTRPGIADLANTCGSDFEERYNPSNTGNIRANSRFTLADNLVLTVDPSFQYVKANGGGTVVGQEVRRDVNPPAPRAARPIARRRTARRNQAARCGYIGGRRFSAATSAMTATRSTRVALLAPARHERIATA